MVLDSTGDKTYPNVYNKQGQYLYEFEEYYLFVLENHVYRTAGRQHWKKLCDEDGWQTEGVSLNSSLFARAMNAHSKDFMVYDKKRRRVFRLNDREKVTSAMGTEVRKGKKLVVMPLEAFCRDSMDKVPRKLE